MATSVGRGRICLTLFNKVRPRKPPNARKHLSGISYASSVIAYLVTNCVAMATRVGLCKIRVTSFGSLIQTPLDAKNSEKYDIQAEL